MNRETASDGSWVFVGGDGKELTAATAAESERMREKKVWVMGIVWWWWWGFGSFLGWDFLVVVIGK